MAADRTLIHIRERSFFDLLDLALVIVGRRPRALALAALGGCAPFAALNAWLFVESPDFQPFLYFLLLGLEIPWATAPLTIVLGGLMFGERTGFGRVCRTMLRCFGPMFVFQGLLRIVLLFPVLTIPIIPARFAFLNEVILLERGRWRAIGERTGILNGGRGGDFFLRWVVQLIFLVLFVIAFWWASTVFWKLFVMIDTWEEVDLPILYGRPVQLAVWLGVCFFTIARFLAYIDQRIRLEGWEVELRLRQAGAMMEDADRW